MNMSSRYKFSNEEIEIIKNARANNNTRFQMNSSLKEIKRKANEESHKLIKWAILKINSLLFDDEDGTSRLFNYILTDTSKQYSFNKT